MRDIAAAAIEQAVRDLCIEANRHLPGDIRRAVQEAAGREAVAPELGVVALLPGIEMPVQNDAAVADEERRGDRERTSVRRGRRGSPPGGAGPNRAAAPRGRPCRGSRLLNGPKRSAIRGRGGFAPGRRR